MKATVHLVEFTSEDLGPALAEMAILHRRRDGWVNIKPRPDEDPDDRLREFAPGPVSTPLGAFNRRRPITVEGTWVPGRLGRSGLEPASVGLEHPAGRFAVRQLRDAGCPVPDGWKVVVDHSRRGLVLKGPAPDGGDATHGEILSWIVRAAAALSFEPITGRWHAEVHRRQGRAGTPPSSGASSGP